MAERLVSIKRVEDYLNSLADSDRAGDVGKVASCPIALAVASVDGVMDVSIGEWTAHYTRANSHRHYYRLPRVLGRFIKLVDSERGDSISAYRAKQLLQRAKRDVKSGKISGPVE